MDDDSSVSVFSLGVLIGALVTWLLCLCSLVPAQKVEIQKDAVRAGVGQYNQTNGHFEWKSVK